MTLKRLVLDTSVLLAFLNERDKDHTQALSGFQSLNEMNTRLIAPSCVVLEVAKRLLFDVNAGAMQRATIAMLETLEILDNHTRNHSSSTWVDPEYESLVGDARGCNRDEYGVCIERTRLDVQLPRFWFDQKLRILDAITRLVMPS
jgi:hypothetical protein